MVMTMECPFVALATPVHSTLFVEDRRVDRSPMWFTSQQWLGEASDCGQLPCRMSGLTMLANKLAYAIAPVGGLTPHEVAWWTRNKFHVP